MPKKNKIEYCKVDEKVLEEFFNYNVTEFDPKKTYLIEMNKDIPKAVFPEVAEKLKSTLTENKIKAIIVPGGLITRIATLSPDLTLEAKEGN